MCQLIRQVECYAVPDEYALSGSCVIAGIIEFVGARWSALTAE
jgi:hypothetical protein